MKKLISKILVCLILSSLILSSCGANEDKVEFKETVSAERVMQQVEAKETVSEEHVLQQAEVEEIVMKESLENNLAESSTESIDNKESGELSFYPPDGAEIVYADENSVSHYMNACYFRGFSNCMIDFFGNENNEVYYYVCFDTRNSWPGSSEVPVEKALEKYGIKVEEVTPAIYVAYVTGRQIISLEKGFNEDEELKYRFLRLCCVTENFVEEWTTEEYRWMNSSEN
ncbi:MAG: hypothetical protein E7614_03030 [Ruminococcaceae bacterium]|nr:hypothetical protein [Oscillospiraceae bacterium]